DLTQSEERLRLIIDTALDAIVMMDRSGGITGWNPQAEKIFGWAKDQAAGQSLARLVIPAEHRDAYERDLQRFLETGDGRMGRRRIERTGVDRAGRKFPMEMSITPAITEGETSFTAFLRDITDRKNAEAVLQESEARLAAASRAKDDFLAVLSH